MALDRAERIIRDREAEQRRIQQARQEAAALPEPVRVDIRHGEGADAIMGAFGVARPVLHSLDRGGVRPVSR